MKSEWVSHNEKKIFFISLMDMDLAALNDELGEIEKTLSGEPERSVLLITDIRGFQNSPPALEQFKNTLTRINKYVNKQTVIGILGIKEKMQPKLDTITGEKPAIFEDIMQAADWLTAE